MRLVPCLLCGIAREALCLPLCECCSRSRKNGGWKDSRIRSPGANALILKRWKVGVVRRDHEETHLD